MSGTVRRAYLTGADGARHPCAIIETLPFDYLVRVDELIPNGPDGRVLFPGQTYLFSADLVTLQEDVSE